MNRREFFSLAAAGAAVAPNVSAAQHSKDLAGLLTDLQIAIRSEIPGVTRIEVECRPEDARMPLMIFAYRD